MAVAGLAALLLLTTSPGSAHPLRPTESLAVATAAAAAVGLLVLGAVVLPRASLLYAAAAGLAFGVASALTKTVAVRITDDGIGGLIGPDIVAVAVFAISGLLLSQAGYRGRGIGAPLATATLVNPVVAAAIGISLFDEGYAGRVPGAALAVAAAAVAGRGVVLLVRLQTSHIPATLDAGEVVKAAPGPDPRRFSLSRPPLRNLGGEAAGIRCLIGRSNAGAVDGTAKYEICPQQTDTQAVAAARLSRGRKGAEPVKFRTPGGSGA